MASQDYYTVLGVNKQSSADEIKRAYKKLVVKYHPDKFTGEKEKNNANAKFQEIQEAYDVLKDDSKKKQYDMLGHDAFKKGGSDFGGAGFDFGGSGFENVFHDFFSGFSGGHSGHQILKGEDLRFSLDLSLEEAFSGYSTTIKIPKKTRCSYCSSSGHDHSSAPVKCRICNGSGKIYVNQLFFRVQQLCENCNGSGNSYKNCSFCNGEGRRNESSNVTINIPKGVENGAKLRLKGEGNAVKGGVNGDLYIFVSVKKHSIFTVDQSNLLITVPISIFDAVLGVNLDIPTLNKEVCSLKVPAGTQSGSKLYIRKKGMPKLNSSNFGDIIVTIEIEIPTYISSFEKDLWLKLQNEYKNSSKNKSFWQKISSYWH